MSNRYYTEYSQRKVDVGGKPGPEPSLGKGGSNYGDTPESMPPYNANIGPGGPDMNRGADFARVKTYVKSKMSPDMSMDGMVAPEQQAPQAPAPTINPPYISNAGTTGSSQSRIAEALSRPGQGR